MAGKRISEEDCEVGRRVKLRRSLLGVSLTDLAEAIDVTFQQVQKYEKGENRISAGTLMRIARALDTPGGYFLGERIASDSADAAMLSVSSEARADMLRLVYAVMAIKCSKTRKGLLDIARALAKQDEEEEERKAA